MCLEPFPVCRQVSPYANVWELPGSIRIHQVQPVSLLDMVVEDPFMGQQVEPLPAVEVDGEEEYQVFNVEGSQVYRNQ